MRVLKGSDNGFEQLQKSMNTSDSAVGDHKTNDKSNANNENIFDRVYGEQKSFLQPNCQTISSPPLSLLSSTHSSTTTTNYSLFSPTGGQRQCAGAVINAAASCSGGKASLGSSSIIINNSNNDDGGGGGNSKHTISATSASASFSTTTTTTTTSSSSTSSTSHTLDSDGEGNSMASNLSASDASKLAAARACVKAEVRSGMRLGIGSGTTVRFLVESLGEAYSTGKITDIQCVPTSYQTREWLREANLPIQTIDTLNELDVTIDGADEVDENLTCIKGGGGCLLQEKLVQLCAKRFVIMATVDKLAPELGKSYPSIPIEVVPYGWAPVKKWITASVGGKCVLRMDQKKCFPTITENHNYIFDWHFPRPVPAGHNWHNVHQKLINITGVVETGLFIDVADVGYFGSDTGAVKVVQSKKH